MDESGASTSFGKVKIGSSVSELTGELKSTQH